MNIPTHESEQRNMGQRKEQYLAAKQSTLRPSGGRKVNPGKNFLI